MTSRKVPETWFVRFKRWLITWFIDRTLTEATGIYHNFAKRGGKP